MVFQQPIRPRVPIHIPPSPLSLDDLMASVLDRWPFSALKDTWLQDVYGDLYAAYWSWRTNALETLRTLRFPSTVHHRHGPAHIDAQPNDLVVTCLVKNGEPYIDEFIDHYRDLGARHLVFLDNGSTDDTVPRAAHHSDTTVLSTDAPFGTYKTIMRRYLVSQFGGENWVLCADIDEFFDYPYSDRVGLSAFLSYLNEHDYNAVALQMLDMLPGASLSEIDASTSLRDQHVYYDLSNITTHDYESNDWLHDIDLGTPELRTHRQGVRHELFDMRDGRPLLTKHTLLRLTGDLRPSDLRTHHVDNARIADVSCVLYHYKFTATFQAYARRAVDEASFSNDSEEYRAYLEALQDEETELATEGMTRLRDTADLLRNDFLVASAAYEDFALNARKHATS